MADKELAEEYNRIEKKFLELETDLDNLRVIKNTKGNNVVRHNLLF